MAKTKDQNRWRCLSIRQPHAWAIIMGAKDIENRSWKSNYCGRLYIHAGMSERNETVVEDVTARVAKHLRIPVSAAREAYRVHREVGLGAIIGSVHMVGCATSYDSEWFDGDYGFILGDPQLFDVLIPCKGLQRIPVLTRPFRGPCAAAPARRPLR